MPAVVDVVAGGGAAAMDRFAVDWNGVEVVAGSVVGAVPYSLEGARLDWTRAV